jgi:hypothetical protein
MIMRPCAPPRIPAHVNDDKKNSGMMPEFQN